MKKFGGNKSGAKKQKLVEEVEFEQENDSDSMEEEDEDDDDEEEESDEEENGASPQKVAHVPRRFIVYIRNTGCATEDEIKSVLAKKCGDLRAVKVPRDWLNNDVLNFAYAEFTSPDGYNKALQLTNVSIKPNHIIEVKPHMKKQQRFNKKPRPNQPKSPQSAKKNIMKASPNKQRFAKKQKN